MELQSDPTKIGERNAVVIEQHLKMVMTAPHEVQPVIPPTLVNSPRAENRKQFTVRLTRGGKPVANHPFRLTTDYADGSGGHDHTAPRRTQSRDNFGHAILTRTATHVSVPYTAETQNDGEERFEYVASIWGDIMKLRVESAKKSLLWDTLSVEERVPSLILFNGAGSYSLTGSLHAHPRNHYLCNQVAIDSLILASNAFAKSEWNTTGNMRLNDMSLELGGLFDVDSNWSTPHKAHRIGRSVDIENLALIQIDTADAKTGKAIKLTVPKVKWVESFVDFMEHTMRNWDFEDEGQINPDVFKRTRKYPHFEWKGN